MNDDALLPFLLRHALIGVAVGWLLLGVLLRSDLAGIGTLLWQSEHALTVLAMAAVGFGATFGGLAAATAIFLLPRE